MANPSNEAHIPEATALVPVPLSEVRRREMLVQQARGPAAADLLMQYWLGIKRYAWQIGLLAVMAVAVAALYVYRIPKQYEAVAVIRVDPTAPDTSVVSSGPGSNNTGGAMDGMMATDAAEILSPSVMGPAEQKLHLVSAPGAPRVLGASVNRPEGTYLLQVHGRASTPELAAEFANVLAQEFLDHEFDTRSAALNDLSGYMRTQLQELQTRMERSQLKLDQFLIDNNLPNPQAKFDQQDQVLTSLYNELAGDRGKQRSLEAEMTLVKDNDLDALLVSSRASTLNELLTAQKQAEIDFTKLQAQYGPGNYVYQQAERQLQHLADLIKSQENHIGAQIQAELDETNDLTAKTQKAFDDENAIVQASSEKAIQYGILKTEADADQSLYNDLVGRINAAEITVGYRSTAMRVVDSARPNPAPVYPRPGYTMLMAGLLALCLGLGVAIAIAALDQTFATPDAVRAALGETILASLPTQDETGSESLLTAAKTSGRRSLYAEAVLGLRTTLLLGASGKARTLMVVSAQPQEGKSTTAANLAAAYAVLGLRTVLVDADIRRPQVHRHFEVPNRVGLSSLLQQRADVETAVFPTAVDKLFVLPAGPAVMNPTELLAISISAVIEELKAKFEIVIVDTPPLLDFADARAIAGCVDTCVIVVRAGTTPRELVISAVQELRQVRAHIGGIVLNAVNPQMSHYYHYRHGYSRYGYEREDEDEQAELEAEAGGGSDAVNAAESAKSAKAAAASQNPTSRKP